MLPCDAIYLVQLPLHLIMKHGSRIRMSARCEEAEIGEPFLAEV